MGEFAFNHVVMNLTAPHIEDLVMLPTPVLRLLNVLDDDYLENEEEYEGQGFLNFILMCLSCVE